MVGVGEIAGVGEMVGVEQLVGVEKMVGVVKGWFGKKNSMNMVGYFFVVDIMLDVSVVMME